MNWYGVISKGLLAAGFLFFSFVMFGDGDAGFATGSLALGVLFIYLAARNWREPRPVAGQLPTGATPPNLNAALIACGAILGIDVFLLGATLLGMLVMLALILWLLPSILFAWRKPDLRRHRALVALIAAATFAADMAAYSAYEAVAEKRVVEVADALAQYKSRHGAYPKTLENLVPDHLPAIPDAKPGLVVLNGIWYRHNESGPILIYTSFPPLGSRVLDVETRVWTAPN